jgi:transposase
MSLRVVVRSLELAGVILGPERHRRWSDAQKIKIVGETLVPGVRVSEVMARYNVSSSLVYTWRKQARLGLFGPMRQGAFAPVAIVEAAEMTLSDNPICMATRQDLPLEPVLHDQTASELADLAPNSDGTAMIVALPDGVRILVNNNVDEGALGKVLRALAQVPAQSNAR